MIKFIIPTTGIEVLPIPLNRDHSHMIHLSSFAVVNNQSFEPKGITCRVTCKVTYYRIRSK